MPDHTTATEADAERRAEIDYDRFASYEDGDSTVICDRTEPAAWLKSDVTATLDP